MPQSGYAYVRLTPISSRDMLKTFFDRINNLIELELASKIMAGATLRKKQINPMDYVYRSLGCHLRLLDEGDTEAQYLLKYITAGKSQGAPWYQRGAANGGSMENHWFNPGLTFSF